MGFKPIHIKVYSISVNGYEMTGPRHMQILWYRIKNTHLKVLYASHKNKDRKNCRILEPNIGVALDL